MTRWYRAYEGTVTDPKLGEVAMVAGCSRSVAIATWHCLLESAASVNEGGRFDHTARRIAVILGEPLETIQSILDEMEALEMIEGRVIAAWSRRQYESDSSTERSRKHRERKRSDAATSRNGDATLQQRRATPPETETETDTEVVVVEDAGASAKPPEIVPPVDGWKSNLKATADELARIAGVPNVSPAAIDRNEQIVRRWIDDGFDVEADIIPTIRTALSNTTDRIGTLKFFDNHVRQAKARKEARTHGSGTHDDGSAPGKGRPLSKIARIALASVGT